MNSTWLDQPGFDTNFQEFLKVYDPAIDNREDAVKATPSWKIVSRVGFVTIASVSVFPAPPKKKFNTVEIIYVR